MVVFDPDFDPRLAASVLRDAALVLEVELDLRDDPTEAEEALETVQRELSALLPYARAWAEHNSYPNAEEIPDAIALDLNVDQTAAFLRKVADLLEQLAEARERRQMN